MPSSLALERGSKLRHPSSPSGPAPALRLGEGSVVRVADATGSKTWHARISYVNGEIFGLRGSAEVDRLFAARDMVTLHIGSDEVMLESQARVLASGTRTLRVLVKRGVGALERRGSVRIQVPQLLSVRSVDRDASYAIVGQLLDLSLGGCALRTRQRLEVGTRVVVTTDAGCVPLQLVGEIVRVWRAVLRVGVTQESSSTRCRRASGTRSTAISPSTCGARARRSRADTFGARSKHSGSSRTRAEPRSAGSSARWCSSRRGPCSAR